MGRLVKLEQPAFNPAQVIYDKLNMKPNKKTGIMELPKGYRINGNRVIVAAYERPEKSKGGIIYTQQTQDEQKNQGKQCLVVALGPTAFVSDKNYDFQGFKLEIGEWVAVWVYEARPIKIEGHECRIVRDTDIICVIPTPDSIY